MKHEPVMFAQHVAETQEVPHAAPADRWTVRLKAFRARGVPVDFRATGQTGIMIAGAGIPTDAVVSDFVAGAAEILSADASATIEETIKLTLKLANRTIPHARFAGVTLSTSGLTARKVLAEHSPRLRLPVADPLRGGREFDLLVTQCLA
jgi:uncharacterized NAD-dependent epimerase/dehydratase family protein